MERYKKLGKNIALITAGNLLSKMMSFLLIPFYTAILTTTEYGIADTMTTTVNLLLPPFTLLLYEAMMRFTLEQDSNKEAIFTTGAVVVALGTVLFSVVSLIAFRFIPLQISSWYFIAYYIAVALHTFLSYFTRGVEKIKIYSISGILHTFCFLVLNILFLAIFKIGLSGYLLSLIIGNIIASAFLLFFGKLGAYFQPKQFDRKLLKSMVRYSVPMIPNSLNWWVSNSADKYLILFFCGFSATGIYSAAQRIPTMFALISTIFMGAWQISAVEDFGSEKTRQFFTGVYRQYSALNNLLVAGIILFVKPLCAFLLSADFAAGWQYIPILLFAFLFHALSGFLATIYTSAKKTKMIFVSTLLGAISNIVLNAFLIPLLGLQGAAIATFISYFVIWLFRLVNTRSILTIQWNKTKDIVSYVLLTAEVLCMLLLGGVMCYIVCAILMLVLAALNLSELHPLLSMAKSMLVRK